MNLSRFYDFKFIHVHISSDGSRIARAFHNERGTMNSRRKRGARIQEDMGAFNRSVKVDNVIFSPGYAHQCIAAPRSRNAVNVKLAAIENEAQTVSSMKAANAAALKAPIAQVSDELPPPFEAW